MPPDQTVLRTVLDGAVADMNECFQQLLYGITALNLGRNVLDSIAPGVSVTAVVGPGLEIDPIPLAELKSHWNQLPGFTLQVIHEHMIQVWQTSLDDMFVWLLLLHFSGDRRFTELKIRSVQIDFRERELGNLSSYLQDRLKADFEFSKYSERVKVINDALSKSDDTQANLEILAKHVEVRNAFQHHRGYVTALALKNIGREAIELPDQFGKASRYTIGDKIQLSYSAIDEFRRSVLIVTQTWREFDG